MTEKVYTKTTTAKDNPLEKAECECSVCVRQGMRLGAQLRKARDEAKLTQVELARMAGVSSSTIQWVESSGSGTSLQKLEAISKALGTCFVIGVETNWAKDFKRPKRSVRMSLKGKGVRHGTTTAYTNYGCRCRRCKLVGSVQKYQWREKQKENVHP